jgi:hypothetical protein
MTMAMPDPYTPTLEGFAFTDAEKIAIAAALTKSKPWDWKPDGELGQTLKSVKKKIHDLHMARHGHRCCYCRKTLKGGGHFDDDNQKVRLPHVRWGRAHVRLKTIGVPEP